MKFTNKYPAKICEICGKSFLKKITDGLKHWSEQKFCSRLCSDKSRVGGKFPNRKPKVYTKEGREKMVTSMVGNKRASGFKMTEEHRHKIIDAHSGDKSHFWKGGITELSKLIRQCYKYRQWRSDVFTRDDYTCQWCGVRGSVEIHPDHIKTFSSILKENNIKSLGEAILCEELWNINNGRTLCIKCHKKTDTYGGKNKNL
jgi:hypothetical protein